MGTRETEEEEEEEASFFDLNLPGCKRDFGNLGGEDTPSGLTRRGGEEEEEEAPRANPPPPPPPAFPSSKEEEEETRCCCLYTTTCVCKWSEIRLALLKITRSDKMARRKAAHKPA